MQSGFVSILGRPNAGKSTLLNALIGEKVAIVTAKPQTTRTRIHGIVEVPARKGKNARAQIVFVDTPGVHRPGSQLDRSMMQEIHQALEQSDAVLLLVDAVRRLALPEDAPEPGVSEAPSGNEEAGSAQSSEQAQTLARARNSGKTEDAFLLSLVRKLDRPVFLVINKIDLVAKDKLLPLIARLSSLHDFAEVIPISARKKDGLNLLIEKLVEYLPQGQRYFPQDQFTDQPERFLVSELIRERILLETGEEVPYASAVVVERFEEPDPRKENGLTRISAAIYCERPGQKAILIGKGGSKLKSIGTAARKEIESLLNSRVYLELHVLVEESWRESRGFIEAMDWRKQLEDMAAHQEAIPLPLIPSPQAKERAKNPANPRPKRKRPSKLRKQSHPTC